jgi:hypothetical protein
MKDSDKKILQDYGVSQENITFLFDSEDSKSRYSVLKNFLDDYFFIQYDFVNLNNKNFGYRFD